MNTLFLGVTGSVASRLTPHILHSAWQFGFEKTLWHPTESALPFLFETILHLLQKEAVGASLQDALLQMLHSGGTTHATLKQWLGFLEDRAETLSKPIRERICLLATSYEMGDETLWIASRERGHIRHIEVARQATVALIAPATANTIAKIVHGITDDFLMQTIRAIDHTGKTPVFIAPAMNTEMLLDPFTEKNLWILKNEGAPKYHILPTSSKLLQCWELGDGALCDIDVIFEAVTKRTQALLP